MKRRSLLLSALASCTGPAVVHASSIMRVVPQVIPFEGLFLERTLNTFGFAFYTVPRGWYSRAQLRELPAAALDLVSPRLHLEDQDVAVVEEVIPSHLLEKLPRLGSPEGDAFVSSMNTNARRFLCDAYTLPARWRERTNPST